jgi:hypothetical protein
MPLFEIAQVDGVALVLAMGASKQSSVSVGDACQSSGGPVVYSYRRATWDGVEPGPRFVDAGWRVFWVLTGFGFHRGPFFSPLWRRVA